MRNVREKIVELLKEHPEGLIMIDIAALLGMNRHTITKYIYRLIGEGVIIQRIVGSAKLCYLDEKAWKRVEKKKPKVTQSLC